MDAIKLKARIREGRGKGYARKARVDGWIPAVYYGHNMETQAIEIDARDFATIVRNKNTSHLIELDLPGGEATSIIKDIQKHVYKDANFKHVDFQHIARGEKITIDIAVNVIGVCKGVKDEGGIFTQAVRKLTVQVLPSKIPDHFDVDISNIGLGESLHIRDLNFEDVEFAASDDTVIAYVSAPKEVVEEVAEVEDESKSEDETK